MPTSRKVRRILYRTSLILAATLYGQTLAARNALATPVESNGAPGTATAPTDPRIPNDYRLNLLIRTTIIALNHANRTGNYTVLRDLGAPDFQRDNTAAKLSEAFAALRASGFDLSPILFFEPKLVKKPEIQPNGLLRLSGFFQTQPQQVNFDLAFQNNNQDWRLYGIALTTTPANAAASDAPAKTESPKDKPPAEKEQAKSAAPKATKPAQKQ